MPSAIVLGAPIFSEFLSSSFLGQFNAEKLYTSKWNYLKDKNGHSGNFYIETCQKSMGLGNNLSPLKVNKCGDLRILLFLLKEIMIVQEIKNNAIFNKHFLNT